MSYTDDELLDALRRFADEHGRPPTVPEANDPAREELPVAQTFTNHFGGWNTAIAKAGLEPRDRRRSDEELLSDLREFAENHNALPTATAVRACKDMATPQTYMNRFGSWNAALEVAGLPTFAANAEGEEGADD